MYVIARNYPKNIHGLREWYQSSFILGLGLALLLARGFIPDLFSIILANVLLLICFMVMNHGTRKFALLPARNNNKLLFLFITSYVLLFLWFTYVQPDIGMRVLWTILFSMAVATDQLHVVIKKLPVSTGRNLLAIALIGVIVTRLARLTAITLGYEQPAGLFDASTLQLVFLATPAIMIPLATVSYIMLATEKLHQNLEFMNHHDDLTGCLNKKTGIKELTLQIHRAKRYRHHFSVMMIDLDNFKVINDTLGHLEGDRVLMDFAQKTKSVIREIDFISRFGGDEFMIILPDTSLHEAKLLSDRIHQSAHQNTARHWTVSIGISAWKGEEDTLDALLTRADKSLYLSKKLGKNQTQLDEALVPNAV